MNVSTLATVTLAAVAVTAAAAQAGSAVIGASKDNTLYQDPFGNDLSNGAGPHMFCGNTTSSGLRRAVFAFDVAGSIPPGSTIDSAGLRLHLSMSPIFMPAPQNCSLHRLLADWGEGTSDTGLAPGGAGAPATPGDATWLHTFFPGSFWTAPGGDHVAAASATVSVGSFVNGPGDTYTWSSAAMIADVQAWLDAPATNFGWVLVGNEAVATTARRFDTKENTTPGVQPQLFVTFTPPPPCPEDTDGDNMVGGSDLVNVILDWGTDGSANGGDVDGSGTVDGADLVAVILAWGPC